MPNGGKRMEEIKKEESRQLVLKIFEEVTGNLAESIIDQVLKAYHTPYTEIVLLINSIGGETSSAFHLYDFLKCLEKPIYTIAFGNCKSCATILFATGEKRYVSKNLTYLIHPPFKTFHTNENLNNNDIAALSKRIENIGGKIERILTEHSDLSAEAIHAIFQKREETIFTAQETIEKGFATDMLVNLNDIITNPINF